MTLARTCPALFLAAPASGQGKTTLVAALARHHSNQGRQVRVFKTGPDFLDPMVLGRAAGTPVESLDLWMVGQTDSRRKLYEAAGAADPILIEGAMGLFDGTPSGADLAQTFGVPAAAPIDARGMGQTFGALALGLARDRPRLPFAGVVANRVADARHAEMLAAGVPADIPFLGARPRVDDATLPSRHLALVQAREIADLAGCASRRRGAGDRRQRLGPPAGSGALRSPAAAAADMPPLLAGRRIAVARDAAFSFISTERT
jgi:cobyrinic acid a,c-diamide synthase